MSHSILYGFVTISALKGILNHDILSFVSKIIDLSNYCMFLRLWKAIHVQNMIFRLHWTWNYNIWCMYIVKIWTNLSYLNNKNASCFPGSRFQTFGVGVESRQWLSSTAYGRNIIPPHICYSIIVQMIDFLVNCTSAPYIIKICDFVKWRQYSKGT